ncbi:MAG: hypothetical protein KDD43_01830, partial [Bdellovibrionales bacterium]|nr:hypothetical protein [Bdellovibrionales bacterium]
NVLCWLDKSGNGYQALSAGGTPLWQLDGSRNVVAFTNDSLQITAGGLGAVFDSGSTLDQVEVLAVMKSTNSSEDGYLIHHPAGGDLSIQLPDASSNAYISVNGSGNGTLSAAWGGNTTNYFRWDFISDNSGGGPYQEIFRNNSSVTSDATADSISIALETFYIGDNGSSTKFQNMNLGELFVFKRRLTADERTILRVHTDNKWDLP